ncbi:MAG: DUF177 domain-containing protein [Hyphomicrobiales bacterium]
MKSLKDYIIPFRGLKIGVHNFKFDINKELFEFFESSEVIDAKVKALVEMERKETMLILNFKLHGQLKLQCSRCLGDLDFPVEAEETLYIKFGSEEADEGSDDIRVLSDKDNDLDISKDVYEYIMLQVPFQVLHPDDEDGESTCDPAILERLQGFSKENTIDPRWEALNKLKKDKE